VTQACVQYCLPFAVAHSPLVPHSDESVHAMPTTVGVIEIMPAMSTSAARQVPSS